MVIGTMPSGEVWPDILIFNSQVCNSLIKSEIALRTSLPPSTRFMSETMTR